MPTELETFPFNYNEDYGAQLACAYRNKQYISEEVCKGICWQSDEEHSHGEGRWTEHVVAMFECDGEYYGLDFDRGLTERQENEYWKQVPKKYEKVQVVTHTFKKVKEESTDDDKT